MFRGYWNRPDDTAAALRPTAGSARGDVVRVDDDGWAYVVDRVKDMIISGGENVYPSEVEAAIAALPGVVDCAVVARPGRALGRGRARLLVIASGPELDRGRAARRAGRPAGPFKIPKYVRFVADLPRTATGKIRKARAAGGRIHPGDPMTRPSTPSPTCDALVGTDLGTSGWVEIDQARIDTFADATDDHQWIHVDPRAGQADGPFGTTIAHGYLTLSLLIPMWTEILDVGEARTKVNYGLNKVRFPAPVPVGSKIRATARLAAVEPIAGGVQVTVDAVIERDGGDKPVCVAQPVFRFYA